MSNKDIINRYLLEQIKNGKLDKEMSLLILKEINQNKEQAKTDIAVIGLACKFPRANNIKDYWENLKNGVETIGRFPDEREKDSGKGSNMRAGYLDEIDKFDAPFFRLSPKEASLMHPTQRLFLETVWEAIEDAGYANDKINGSKTAVYVGIDHTYLPEYGKKMGHQDLLVMTGGMTSILASRISYILNLRGPSLVIDTACSSGLVSVHTACKALKNKECTVAIAGGINLIEHFKSNFEGVESTEGKLSAFDKNSKGTVWGEGIGAVILKPLEQAVKDRDNIYAVIKGSAVNNDGTTNGITAPSSETQADAIVSAWEDASINPETISYIEAHATGTVLGDPIEIKGLKLAFERYTDKKQFCGIGAVKPNIGHAVGAAAISSMIKAVLALKHKEIPSNINFVEPNPFIDFLNSPIYVSDKLIKWETEGFPRRAGVSSFGFSRTNCHVVLEEPPESTVSGKKDSKGKAAFIFTLSAKNENALKEYISKYDRFIRGSEQYDIADICFTTATGRGHYSHRLAMVVRSEEDFAEKIRRLSNIDLNGINEKDIFYKEHKVVADNLNQKQPMEITNREKRELDAVAAGKAGQISGLQNEEYERALNEICRLYIRGADVNWEDLYKGAACRKVSLPTYPFERKRYWLNIQEPAVTEKAYTEKEISHPLIDRRILSTLNQEVYLTRFSVDRHWVLSEHTIMDLNIVPGTTYLEMARKAGSNLYRDYNIELRDIMFLTPLVVAKDEKKEVHTIIKKEKDYLEFVIASRTSNDGSELYDAWVVHAEGKICKLDDSIVGVADVGKIRSNCNKEEIEVDTSLPMGEFKFGPRWRSISKIHINENEMLSEIKLGDELVGDLEECILHPALLDCAINMAIEKMVQRVQEGTYLPLSYKSLKLYGPMPAKFYSRQKITCRLDKNSETVSLDISLIRESGEIFAEIQGYLIKKVKKDAFKFSGSNESAELYHEMGWAVQDIKHKRRDSKSGNILIMKDEKDFAGKVIGKLKNGGNNVIEVCYGKSFKKIEQGKYEINADEESYMKLISEFKDSGLSQIIHMMSIHSDGEINTVEELEDRKNRGVYSLFHLTRALMENKVNKDIDIVLVSDYVNEVTKREERINPHNASLYALGKVVRNEYSGLACRCIDIDGSTTAEEFVRELSSEDKIYQVAYRDGSRYVEEFRELNVEAVPGTEVEIKDNGVYLITGGTGGIGLEIAKYLAAKNKVNLAFVNRTKLPEKQKWDEILETNEDKKLCGKLNAIKEIEKAGATVVCCSADVTSAKDMESVVEKLRTEFGRINGVVHSAGLAGEGIIIRKDFEKFKKVMAPKIEGTWLLDKLTGQDKPDFFVMFSSILAIVGVMGQSDYAAANAYMDSFAAFRNKKGGKTAAINWTVWKEAGMATDYNIDEVRGTFKAVTNAKGLGAFENALNKRITRFVVGELDYGRINSIEEDLGVNLSPEFKTKVEKRCAHVKNAKKAQGKKQAANVVFKGAEGANEIEMKIAQVWAEVLALEEVTLYDSFSELGGDSIIAANLLKAMEKEFPGMLDISDIFTYPTIKQMAGCIGKKMNAGTKIEDTSSGSSAITAESEAAIEEVMNRLARGEISMSEADELIEKLSANKM
ncbi:MAG: type I polyketide synthase [Clostridia bacterium]|nr:type I polyketide synthase [Clostridia bacterium]